MGLDFTWLEENILLRKLDEQEKTLLGSLIQVVDYQKDDVIVSENQPGGTLYILRSGTANIYRGSGVEEVRLATAKEGSLFGEMSFLTGDNASATVTANESTTIYQLTRNAYSELMQKNQDLVFALFAHVLVHTAKVIRHMNEEHIALQHYITGRRV